MDAVEEKKVVLTEDELKHFDLNDPETIELIHHAQQSDAADRALTFREAAKKYKKAVFWAMFLSTSLIMEGYDLVIVRARALRTEYSRLTENCWADYIFLRSKPVSESVWCHQSVHWKKGYHSRMAIGLVQLGSRRPAGRPHCQWMDPGQIWLPADNDVLHGVDVHHDLYTRLFSLSVGLGLW